jgi:spermidine synthase
VPCAVAGTVFPFLLRLAQDQSPGAGRALGALSAWNLAGAIAGSLLTGFVLLPLLGLRGVLTLIPAIYLLGATALLVRTRPPVRLLRIAPVAGLVLLATMLNPMRVPLLRVNLAGGERVLHVSESAYGVTAVVDRDGDRRIRVNNHYSLGGSGAAEYERHQALLPLMTHPDPRAIFFLGMGTGITAGAAVQPPVDRIVVAELIPDVVDAARRYFRDDTNRLFDDPRVTVVTADGRTFLAGSAERYDIVIADLFVPWEAGTGNLYTREHFRTVRDRLAPGGRFVQWLPLYQMSRHEFMIVARTMLDVFPHVTVWRGDFLSDRPIVALAGAVDAAPLDPETIVRHGRTIAGAQALDDRTFHAWTLPYYAGNLSHARHLVPDGPLNIDRRPVLEYAAPITHRQQRIGAARWFHAGDLLAFFEDLFAATPPDQDPYLVRLSPAERDLVWTGLRRYTAAVLGSDAPASDAWSPERSNAEL